MSDVVSVFDLPKDEGVLPAGKWDVALWDEVNDSFPGVTFCGGLSLDPVDGRTLTRVCSFMRVKGVRRVEGEPFELGDLSGFGGAAKPAEDAKTDDAGAEQSEPSKPAEDTKGKRR